MRRLTRLFGRAKRVPKAPPTPPVDEKGVPIFLTSGEKRQRVAGLLAAARTRAAAGGAAAVLTDAERERLARCNALLAIVRERTTRATEARGIEAAGAENGGAGEDGHTR